MLDLRVGCRGFGAARVSGHLVNICYGAWVQPDIVHHEALWHRVIEESEWQPLKQPVCPRVRCWMRLSPVEFLSLPSTIQVLVHFNKSMTETLNSQVKTRCLLRYRIL
ncbi:hypothetical protein NMG60_11027995 [Bertholletia excelsa]